MTKVNINKFSKSIHAYPWKSYSTPVDVTFTVDTKNNQDVLRAMMTALRHYLMGGYEMTVKTLTVDKIYFYDEDDQQLPCPEEVIKLAIQQASPSFVFSNKSAEMSVVGKLDFNIDQDGEGTHETIKISDIEWDMNHVKSMPSYSPVVDVPRYVKRIHIPSIRIRDIVITPETRFMSPVARVSLSGGLFSTTFKTQVDIEKHFTDAFVKLRKWFEDESSRKHHASYHIKNIIEAIGISELGNSFVMNIKNNEFEYVGS